MDYNNRIIVDFDDTIATTTTRDWDSAIPHRDVINKINNLYNDGWEVWIITARGQLSCEGDFIKADKKYRKSIESWLATHGVKYHKLSFEKRLAAYYIDDKALLPEEFVDLEIIKIKSGWSGAVVEKRGDRIFKTHHDSIDAASWYNKAAPLVNVPIVHSMIGQTLCLEYLEDNGSYFKIDEINSNIDKFSLYKTSIPFSTYIDRVQKHVDVMDESLKSDSEKIMVLLKRIESYCNIESSFMHGDLSLENLIQTDKGLFLIDPIYKEDQWSSYLLDISKMLHSYRKYDRMFEYQVFFNSWLKKGVDEYTMRLLEVTQWIRIIKYIPDPVMKEDIIKKTKELLSFII